MYPNVYATVEGPLEPHDLHVIVVMSPIADAADEKNKQDD